MKPRCACTFVTLLLLNIQDICSSAPICLTWNITGSYVNVKCSVKFEQNNILIVDPFGNNRIHCNVSDSKRCSKNYAFDQLFEEQFENFKTLTLKTDKFNAEGKWKCRHGNKEASSYVSYTEAIDSNVDVKISGEFRQINESTTFKVVCSSCWKPFGNTANIYVNNVLLDSIRYFNGKCYHKFRVCTPLRCSCSTRGNTFSWILNNDLPYIKFTCKMDFMDEIASRIFHHQAGFIFNRSVIIQTNGSSNNSKELSETTNTYNDEVNNPVNFECLVLAIVGVMTIVTLSFCVLRITYVIKSKALEKENSTRRKQGHDYDKDTITFPQCTLLIDHSNDEDEMTLSELTSIKVCNITRLVIYTRRTFGSAMKTVRGFSGCA